MRPLAHPRVLHWAFTAALALAACGAAHAAAPDSTAGGGARRAPAAPGIAEATHLGRAAREWRTGNLRAVVENLEALDYASPTFPEADRAAFLLGRAYLRLGERARFESLAHAVSAWPRPSLYTRWLLAEASWLGGVPDSARLAAASAGTRLGRDLEGIRGIREAVGAMDRGEDPAALLAAVPPGSRASGSARHMLGKLAIERGEVPAGEAILDSLWNSDTLYEARREVGLTLAGLALDRGDWGAAHRIASDVDRDWTAAHLRIAGILARGDFDSLWRSWQSGGPGSDAWLLDSDAAAALAERLASALTDLRARPEFEVPLLDVPSGGAALAPPPSSDAWREVETSAATAGAAAAALTRARWALEREREALAARRHYLAYGGDQARRVADDLAARAATLDSLRASIEALVQRLRGVRDAASRRVLERAAAVSLACENSIRWMRAMAHFHLSGPERERAKPMPPGIPSRDVMLAEEEALTRAILALAQDLAAGAPELIARSHDESWGPRLVDRILAQSAEAARSLAWARALGVTVDSSRALAVTSDSLRAFETRVARLDREADAALAAHHALRDRVARETLKAALARLGAEREGVDYALAVAAYGQGVRLAPAGADSAAAPRRAAAPADSSAMLGAGEDDDPTVVMARDEAIVRHSRFLARHPRSFARGEMRFRLADLLLVDARHRFREDMAAYMQAQSEGRAAGLRLPVLSNTPALALYRALLAEDQGFPHRDAALFNAGMILADGADPEARTFFEELVSRHPDSRYAQESHLRMGDMDFDARRFPAAVIHYAQAARGPDPNLEVIARYKSGWAHFNEDRFTEAADAFRSVLDLYASEKRASIPADIEKEAETYLVHSLAGAGGAEAVLAYFGRVGERTYERRVLMALAQHLRRAGKLAEAAATDALCLERYPEHPDALLAARRLIETRLRSGDAARVREARLEHAATFAPGGRWAKAQDSDSLKAQGAAFARESWETVAEEHHRAARAHGAAADWRQALAIYATLLDTWPNGDDAARLRMRAGEASAALGEYSEALHHYDLAARAGSDSVAADALLQRVAVTDAWYGTTRRGEGKSAVGSDSLAAAVREAADRLLDRFPEHPRAAHLVWRRGQLAYAHGWNEDAAKDFERLMKRHPGDPRVPDAAAFRAEALTRGADFEAAGAAWEDVLTVAAAAGRDTLVRRARTAIPICAYRHAEAAVARDSSDDLRHAQLFEKVATRWPAYENAHAAQYRAGLAYFRAGRAAEGALAMQALIERFPRSTFVRDAHLETARGWEAGKEPARAAEAYVRFAERYPADPIARDAWLKAADLFAGAGQEPRSEELRLAYVKRYPGDFENGLEILEPLARRDLAGVGPGRPVSVLLAIPKASKGAKTAKPAGSPSHLATYLKLAEAHPELASRGVIAQVRFLQGEEAQARCAAVRLSLPLAKSIAAKQKVLNEALAAYQRSVDVGVSEWAHASTYRMGEALVGFGRSLENSERPADLRGEDLLAYEEVLVQQGDVFAGRGEAVWTELLRQKGREAGDDPWIARAKTSLWSRLGNRFFYRPEVDYPRIAADAPERRKSEAPAAKKKTEKPRRERASKEGGRGADKAPPLARGEGGR